MKKTYMSPETFMLLIATQKMIAVSDFKETLDDENPITPEEMLSRRHRTVWDDEEELEEEEW